MYKISLLYSDGHIEDNQNESWSTINKATEAALERKKDNSYIIGFKINKIKEENPTLTKTRRNPVCIY